MKNIFFTTLLLISFSSFGQTSTDENRQPNKWRVGGGIGLGFGTNDQFSFSISPSVGYEITPMLEAGLSAGYQYSKWYSSKLNLFNFGPYVNFHPVNFLFLRGHFEHFIGTQKWKSGNPDILELKENMDESALWLGGGYRSPGRVSFYAGLLYNVLYKDDSSIFSTGLRPMVGVSFGF
jgi:hypothetical protein